MSPRAPRCTPPPPPPAWASDTADGFASVDSLGQNGTYGGRDGKTVTVTTQAELEKYATATEPYVIVVAGTIAVNPVGKDWKDDRFAEYGNSGPGAGAASSNRPHLSDAQAANQEVADWLAGWTSSAS